MRLSKELESKILNFKVLPIKPFKNIMVGDPDYFEQLNEEERVPGTLSRKKKKVLQELTLDTTTSCCKRGVVMIAEVEERLYEGKPEPKFRSIYMEVALSSARDFEKAVGDFKVYTSGKVYAESVKRTHNLACDGSSFEVCVDGRFDEVCTGSDGFYGYAHEMKQYYGFVVGFSFDRDLFSFEDVEKMASYWFEVDTKALKDEETIARLERELRENIEGDIGKEECRGV